MSTCLLHPACNIQCNFCNRKFDCVNESRPGVTSSILSPDQAMAYLADVVEAKPNTSVVGIAGPGDPFANGDKTMETLTKVRATYPEMLLCVATNGMNIHPYLDELKAINTTHVSITINAVDPAVGAKIYAWVRNGKRSVGPAEGAKILLERQLAAVNGLKERNIMVKVNSILLPGINEAHMVEGSLKRWVTWVWISSTACPISPQRDQTLKTWQSRAKTWSGKSEKKPRCLSPR